MIIFFQISFTNSTLLLNTWYLADLVVNFFTLFSSFCIMTLSSLTVRTQTSSTVFYDCFFHCCCCFSRNFWLICCKTALSVTAVKAVSFRSKIYKCNNEVISARISFTNWLIWIAVWDVIMMLIWTSLKFVRNAKREVVDWERFEVITEELYRISSAACYALKTFLVVIAVDLTFW